MDIRSFYKLNNAIANTKAIITRETSFALLDLFGDLGHPCCQLQWEEIAGEHNPETISFIEWVTFVSNWSANNGGWSFHLNLVVENTRYDPHSTDHKSESIGKFTYESSGGRIVIEGDFDHSFNPARLGRLTLIVQSRSCGDWKFDVLEKGDAYFPSFEDQLAQAMVDPIRGQAFMERVPRGIARRTPLLALIDRALELRAHQERLEAAEYQVTTLTRSVRWTEARVAECREDCSEQEREKADIYLANPAPNDLDDIEQDDFVPPIDPELLRAFGAEVV